VTGRRFAAAGRHSPNSHAEPQLSLVSPGDSIPGPTALDYTRLNAVLAAGRTGGVRASSPRMGYLLSLAANVDPS
jgi:hypothetical protein